MSSSAASEKKLSFKVFMDFVGAEGDASKLVEKECFQRWVATRKSPPQHPEESYRRVLTAHICGLDGRKPFPRDVEASLLPILRKKATWPCFKGSDITIGIRGFRKSGYHESKKVLANESGKTSEALTVIKHSRKARKRKVSELSLSDDSLFSGFEESLQEKSKQKRNSNESLLVSPEQPNNFASGSISDFSFLEQLNANQLSLQLIILEQMKLLQGLSKSQMIAESSSDSKEIVTPSANQTKFQSRHPNFQTLVSVAGLL